MSRPTQENRQAFLQFSQGFETRARHDLEEVQLRAKQILPSQWRDDKCTDEKAKKLLHWFKHDYFKWVDQPPCRYCASKTKFVNVRRAETAQERQGLAGRVEVYQCEVCSQNTEFPRYNHPIALFDSKSGRCGEFANAFCALAIAAGFQTRYVLDLTDHVWAELFSIEQKRWVHCDPCENAFDSPLMYESGWNKQLSFCFAYEQKGKVRDVTRRYSRKWDGPMIVRRSKLCSTALVNALRAFAPVPLDAAEVQEFHECVLETSLKKPNAGRKLKPEEEVGRISGSKEWKSARGEDGKAVQPQMEQDKARFQQRFHELVKQGLPPNQACVQALKEMQKKD